MNIFHCSLCWIIINVPVVNVDTLHLEVTHVIGDAISEGAAGGEAVLVTDDLPELKYKIFYKFSLHVNPHILIFVYFMMSCYFLRFYY